MGDLPSTILADFGQAKGTEKGNSSIPNVDDTRKAGFTTDTTTAASALNHQSVL